MFFELKNNCRTIMEQFWIIKFFKLETISSILVHWVHQDSGSVSIDRLRHQRKTGRDDPHSGGLSGSGSAVGTLRSRTGNRKLFG